MCVQRRVFATLVAAMLAMLVVPALGAGAAAGSNRTVPSSDVRNVGPNYNDGKVPTVRKDSAVLAAARQSAPSSAQDASIGDVRYYLAIDDFNQSSYLKKFTLRGTSQHMEVWV